MIPLVLLIGGALAATAAAAVVVTFWDEIKQYLKKALQKVTRIVKTAIVGVAVYAQTGSYLEGIKVAYKFYSKDQKDRWQETVATAIVSDNEVPYSIREKLERSNEPIDISKEFELTLS